MSDESGMAKGRRIFEETQTKEGRSARFEREHEAGSGLAVGRAHFALHAAERKAKADAAAAAAAGATADDNLTGLQAGAAHYHRNHSAKGNDQ